ncbi:hypothetical protein FOZ63_020369, partial [Perkinsus olseni]
IMMFGINDMADTDVDKYNPRKMLGYFGGQDPISEFSGVWKVILIANLLPLTTISIVTSDWVFYPFFFAVGFGLNIVYNFKLFALARKAPLDLLCCPAGFLLEKLFACHLNQVPLPNTGPCVFYIASALIIQVRGALTDMDSDARGGKRTTV